MSQPTIIGVNNQITFIAITRIDVKDINFWDKCKISLYSIRENQISLRDKKIIKWVPLLFAFSPQGLILCFCKISGTNFILLFSRKLIRFLRIPKGLILYLSLSSEDQDIFRRDLMRIAELPVLFWRDLRSLRSSLALSVKKFNWFKSPFWRPQNCQSCFEDESTTNFSSLDPH